MGGELLAIVQAEREAERILEEADARKARALQQALAERRRLLQSVTVPEPVLTPPRAVHPDVAGIRRTAKMNRERTIARILEAIHAQT